MLNKLPGFIDRRYVLAKFRESRFFFFSKTKQEHVLSRVYFRTAEVIEFHPVVRELHRSCNFDRLQSATCARAEELRFCFPSVPLRSTSFLSELFDREKKKRKVRFPSRFPNRSPNRARRVIARRSLRDVRLPTSAVTSATSTRIIKQSDVLDRARLRGA